APRPAFAEPPRRPAPASPPAAAFSPRPRDGRVPSAVPAAGGSAPLARRTTARRPPPRTAIGRLPERGLGQTQSTDARRAPLGPATELAFPETKTTGVKGWPGGRTAPPGSPRSAAAASPAGATAGRRSRSASCPRRGSGVTAPAAGRRQSRVER